MSTQAHSNQVNGGSLMEFLDQFSNEAEPEGSIAYAAAAAGAAAGASTEANLNDDAGEIPFTARPLI